MFSNDTRGQFVIITFMYQNYILLCKADIRYWYVNG